MELENQDYIKPDNLIEVISASPADYLIVIGDRNMKNRTCHAKKSGKLVEIPVDERVQSMLMDWNSNSTNKSNLLNKSVDDLTKSHLQDLIQQFSGVKYLSDRFTRLKKVISDLKKTAPKKSSGNYDEKFLGNITQTLSGIIRVHKDFVYCLQILHEIPPEQDDSKKGILITCIETLTLGINPTLKEKLISECSSFIPQVEKMGAGFSEFVNGPTLWDGYLLEIKNKKNEPVVKKKEIKEEIVILKKENVKTDKIMVKAKEVEKVNVIDEKMKILQISTPSNSGWKTPPVVTPSVNGNLEDFPSLGKKKEPRKDKNPDPTTEVVPSTPSVPSVNVIVSEPIKIEDKKPVHHYQHFSYDDGDFGGGMWSGAKPSTTTSDATFFDDLWKKDSFFKDLETNYDPFGTSSGNRFGLMSKSVSPSVKGAFPREGRNRTVSEPVMDKIDGNDKISNPVVKRLFLQKDVSVRHRSQSDAILEKDKPCGICNNTSLFECNFCANLRMKGVDVPQIFFCSTCLQGYKEHQKQHEKLREDYKIFL